MTGSVSERRVKEVPRPARRTYGDMLAALVGASLAPLIGFTPSQPWALGFAAPPRLGFVGDVNADGLADLIVVYPVGDCIIDVNLSVDGQKTSGGFQARTQWGRECQAAVVGAFDQTPGDDVIGIFDGQSLRRAIGFADRKFQDDPDWVRLPQPLDRPALAVIDGGQRLLVWSQSNGEGFTVRLDTKAVARSAKLPTGVRWIGDIGDALYAATERDELIALDRRSMRRRESIGKLSDGSTPAAMPGMLVWNHRVTAAGTTHVLPPDDLPPAKTVFGLGDVDGDGDPDIVAYRYGTERHTSHQVRLYRALSDGETDWDKDGLTNAQESALGTDPMNPDSDNDGLLDGWEVNGFRGLDLPSMGCNPRRIDIICLISRFESVSEEKVKNELERVAKSYAELDTPNPDGSTGFTFHALYLDPIAGDDMKNGWPVNRDKFRPEKWRGVVHWMQITPGGGGQANQLGDGGTCGENSLWAVFLHEFGHQIGMDHNGWWPNSHCPIYTSLMSYAYSYSFEDDGAKIHYSNGRFRDYVLRETNLDETIPLPYEQVKFLEKGPYRFRLQPNGDTTLVDWNWNGIFGEKGIRADINYSYSTTAGRRDDVGKTHGSPWLFVHRGQAFALYVVSDEPASPPADPTVSVERPGRLMLRRLIKPYEWAPPQVIESGGVTGDPVAWSLGDRVWLFYATRQGVVRRSLSLGRDAKLSLPEVVNANPALTPTVGEHQGLLYLFLTDPKTGIVRFHIVYPDGRMRDDRVLDATSTNPVGMCKDTVTGEMVIGLAQDQDEKRPHRWQIRRYRVTDGRLEASGMEWVEGPEGQARGTGRITLLFEVNRDTGPTGRIHFFGRGMTSEATPWACTYVAQQIADKSVRGGWLVKRYYDEWTQSRSAPAAAWFGGDVIWGYRWVDGAQGATDNNLHVAYAGLGIQDEPMGDHDDLTFFRTFGIRHSILNMGPAES